MIDGKTLRDHTDAVSMRTGIFPFSSPPKPDEALLIGLSEAVPACAVDLRFTARIEGVGVDPDDPPLAWEAWTGDGWTACELEARQDRRDQPGRRRRHPRPADACRVARSTRSRPAWLRARVDRVREGSRLQRLARDPRPHRLHDRWHSRRDERRASSATRSSANPEGVPGGRLQAQADAGRRGREAARARGLDRRRVAGVDTAPELRGQRAGRRALRARRGHGEIESRAGGAEADGSLRRVRRRPAAGRGSCACRCTRAGGGRPATSRPASLAVLQSVDPVHHAVENRRTGTRRRRRRGHRDGEGARADPAADRAIGPSPPRTTRTSRARSRPRSRASAHLTAGDGADAGAVRVLIVPAVPGGAGQICVRRSSSRPTRRWSAITRRLDEVRLVGARVVVESPPTRASRRRAAQGRPRTDPTRLQQDALEALLRYYPPDHRRPRRDGLAFRAADPRRRGLLGPPGACAAPSSSMTCNLSRGPERAGATGKPTDRVEVEPNALVFSYEHQVLVEPGT